jgi:predicted metal-dependent hydrolase
LTRISAADSLGSATPLPGQLSLFPGLNAAVAPHAISPAVDDAAAPAESRRDLRPQAAPRQARLPAPDDLAAQERALGVGLKLYLPPGKGLDLRLTNNHYSMISVRRRPDGYRLRIHRMFIGAPPRIVRALARYVVHNDRRASRLLGDYIDRNQHVIKREDRKPRQLTLRTAGRVHDLQAIFGRLNAERFAGKLDARITWGPVAAKRARRSIKMGSYAVEDRIIRIHPVLDQADVPEFFVSWIVFHEMLHGCHDIVRKGHRRIFHSKAFLEEERRYPDYDRASAWEQANLDRLLGG